jgi:hypothetical protein
VNGEVSVQLGRLAMLEVSLTLPVEVRPAKLPEMCTTSETFLPKASLLRPAKRPSWMESDPK